MRLKVPRSAASTAAGMTWTKLLLTNFNDFRDAAPVLSSAPSQDAAGVITWPCNAPSGYGDLRECALYTMPIADLATILGLPDASTLINGTSVVHVRMTCAGEKNVGIMAAYLDRPATNQAGTYGLGVGCYRNTSGTSPKLVGAAIHESSTVTGGQSLQARNPYVTAVLQHPTVNGVNHYGGHVSIWEYDDPAYVKEGGISYTRETTPPETLSHFGVAVWNKAGGSGVAGNLLTLVEVGLQDSDEWAQVSA